MVDQRDTKTSINRNTVQPISPQEIEAARRVNDDLLIAAVNKSLRTGTLHATGCRLYASSIRSNAGGAASVIDIDRVMELFRQRGWKIDKQADVQVDRNEYDTIYDFTAGKT